MYRYTIYMHVYALRCRLYVDIDMNTHSDIEIVFKKAACSTHKSATSFRF